MMVNIKIGLSLTTS